jgi:hypothetical protein
MRYKDFNLTEDELFEIKMSPSNLAKMAKDIDARVGMEFELIVPGVEGEEETESEPDYEYDTGFPAGPNWQREVERFFLGGDGGDSRSYIERQITVLQENYLSWREEKFDEYMGSDAAALDAYEIAQNNVDRSDYESMDEYEQAVLDYQQENEGYINDELRERFTDDESLFEEFLEENDIGTMQDFSYQYEISWPYWSYPESSGELSVEEVADEFSQAIGRPVNWSSSYHGAKRAPDRYVVEPDSSLQGDEGEAGLEFVSPPLTVPEMLSDLEKVAKWAGRVGAYTNESTGLHMNVSVPNQENLDYVKLAILLGDEYVLDQFGRIGNTYCKSALQNIKNKANLKPESVTEMFQKLQGGLNKLASTLTHSGETQKYVSINNKGDYIEFRSPGGDWLGSKDGDLGQVKNTLLRSIVALDAATDPEKFKQEYYKKLYKTLAKGGEGKFEKGDDNTLSYFAKYAAGELPKEELKNVVRQAQTTRKAMKGTGEKYWWRVGIRANPNYAIDVVATTPQEAIQAAMDNDNELWRYDAKTGFTTKALRPYEEPKKPESDWGDSPDANYEIFDKQLGFPLQRFIANTDQEAEQKLKAWAEEEGRNIRMLDVRRIPGRHSEPAAQQATGTETETYRYRVDYQYRQRADQPYMQDFVFVDAADQRAAEQNVRQRLINNGIRDFINVEARMAQTVANTPAPQQQQQQQQQPSTSALPPGNRQWAILDSTGRAVHTFVNRDDQRQAIQYGVQWLNQNIPGWQQSTTTYTVEPAR